MDTQAEIKVESLKWDSDFFGFPIVRVHCDRSNTSKIEEIKKMLKTKGICLAYVITDEWDQETHQKLLNNGARLVDKKTTYAKHLELSTAQKKSSFPVVEFSDALMTDELTALAYASGEYSRFLIDEGFGRKLFEKLYLEWLLKSINGTFADKVWVALDDKKIVGFVTAKKELENTQGQIGLIAVSEAYRGKGIGQALMQQCDRWYLSNKLAFAKVVTQGDNIPACKFYESYGYHVEKVELYYHWWITTYKP